jgi:hypothetical protein
MIAYSKLGQNGRLGNAMFQIAATIGVAVKGKDVAHFPKWLWSTTFEPNINSDLDLKKIAFTYQEAQFHYKEIPYIKGMNLFGYFQTEKYFEHCKELIKETFTFNSLIKDRIETKYKNLLDKNITSIHIRRGDYVALPDHHPIQPLSYYEEGLNIIEEETDKKIEKIVVFSDDLNWCKNNLQNDKYFFAEGNTEPEDMYFMSMCKNNIIVNSSFSWWASYLNKNENKVTIAPEHWFGKAYANWNTDDIYREDMITL